MVLGVIGAGNMAKAMIAGITKSGSLNGEEIIVSNHNLAKAQELSNQYGVKIDEATFTGIATIFKTKEDNSIVVIM